MAMPSGEDKKTIAVRVSPDLRDRLDSILQITGMKLNQAGIEALEQWIANKLADPEVRARALEDLEAREHELQQQRKALQGLVGEQGKPPAESAEAKPPEANVPGAKPSPRRGGGSKS